MNNTKQFGSEPIYMTGYASHWPAIEKWNLDWFKKKFGNKMVGINSGKYVRSKQYSDFAYAANKLPQLFGSYLQAIIENVKPDGYLAAHGFSDEFTELLTDIDLPLFSHEKLVSQHFWISAPETITQLHFDRANNVLIQIFGTKTVYLYKPTCQLKPMRILNNWAVDVSELEVDNFCDSLQTPCYKYDLKPGDALYIPYGWWHKVISLDACASVNQWWWDRSMLATKLPDMLLARIKTAFKSTNG